LSVKHNTYNLTCFAGYMIMKKTMIHRFDEGNNTLDVPVKPWHDKVQCKVMTVCWSGNNTR